MLVNKRFKIKKILGSFKATNGPYEIFGDEIIKFLNEISKVLLNDKKSKKFPDLIAFGFWCRYSNIKRLLQNYKELNNRVGRGSVLHIAPSNVPTNFAYSMMFGLLAGNNNIVRLPSKNFFQVTILCKILKKLALRKKYKKIFKRFLLIKYENSDEISAELSRIVEARIIWGGDETINKFKSFYTQPRCIDLTFANRFSLSIINSNKLANLKKEELEILAQRFYNDTYIMDQFGCSSPNSIFWLGKNNKAKKNFWKELGNIVDKKYNLDLSSANEKISNLIKFTLEEKKNFKVKFDNFNLVKLNHKNINLDKYENISFGTFFEIDLKNINYLKKFVSTKLQTVTYYGVEFNMIKKFIINNNIKGIDRIIPIGRAFDLTSEWDGVDIILTLSRTIGS